MSNNYFPFTTDEKCYKLNVNNTEFYNNSILNDVSLNAYLTTNFEKKNVSFDGNITECQQSALENNKDFFFGIRFIE